MFEKCENLSKSICPDEGNDCRRILSRALDVREYYGRVRGMGHGVTPTSLKKNNPKTKAPSNKELQAKLQALEAEVRELRKEKERDQSERGALGFKETSDKASVNCDFQPNIPEGISPCQLYLSSPTYQMVAKGKVHNTLGEVLHHQPLPAGYLKVSIDIALEGSALLPIPDDVSDVTLVGEAIGAYVAWSSSLIHVDDETPTKPQSKDKGIKRQTESYGSKEEVHAKEIEQVSKVKEPEISNIPTQKKVVAKKTAASKKPTSQYRTCLRTYLGITDIPDGGMRLIPMHTDIFGYDYTEAIGREDMDQVFKHLELGINVIVTYIRFLYDKVMRPRGLEERFAFLSPNLVNAGSIETKPDDVTAYVLKSFVACKDSEKLFFLPYNTGNGGHWLLLAINPVREIVYYLDSLSNDWSTYPALKKMIDTVLQALQSQRGIQDLESSANNITWIRVQCPIQRNGIDCGYFMLRFMKETLLLDRIEIPSTYFDEFKCAHYSKDQLDELMEEWCQFIM